MGVTAFARRANVVSGVALDSGYTCPTGKVCWFNPAAFALGPATGGAGNAGVGSIVGPGYFAWDMSLRKNFKLPREGMNFMFQVDAFNVFNRTNWGSPGTTVGGSLGLISSTNPPRNIQMAARFSF